MSKSKDPAAVALAKRKGAPVEAPGKNPAAVALGKRRAELAGPRGMARLSKKNAHKGGIARAEKLSKKRRKEISQKAAAARAGRLSPERRKEIAQKAIAARWGAKEAKETQLGQ